MIIEIDIYDLLKHMFKRSWCHFGSWNGARGAVSNFLGARQEAFKSAMNGSKVSQAHKICQNLDFATNLGIEMVPGRGTKLDYFAPGVSNQPKTCRNAIWNQENVAQSPDMAFP